MGTSTMPMEDIEECFSETAKVDLTKSNEKDVKVVINITSVNKFIDSIAPLDGVDIK